MEQEQLLATCELLRVLLRDDVTLIMSKMLLPLSEFTAVPNVAADIQRQPKPFLIANKLSFVEAIVLEKLETPGINLFDFLIRTLEVANSRLSQGSGADPEIQKIAAEAATICKNYLVLSVTSPEFFEGKNMAVRFSNLFLSPVPHQINSPPILLSLQLMARLRDDSLREELLQFLQQDENYVVKIMLRMKVEMDKLIVFNQPVFDYQELFAHLMANEAFKRVVLNNFQNGQFKRGIDFEMTTFLSLFFQKHVMSQRQDPLMSEYQKTAIDRVKSCKTKGAYVKTCQVS